MSKLANQWIPLFRVGKYPQGEFTEADLDQVVANYRPADPEQHEAPATIGHPTGGSPAWAWFEAVKREGATLLGKMKDVIPAFEDMVSSRQFPKRSVGLVKRDNGWNLDHVAFLGAEAPQVKGLADCKFASESGLVKVEFQESAMAQEDTVVASMKAWFAEMFKTNPPSSAGAVTTFTEADVKRFAAEAATVAVAAATAPLQAKLDAQAVEFAARETKLATGETTSRADAAMAKLKTSGRWVPAFDKMGLPVVFAELAKVTKAVEFGEGDAKKSLTPLEALVAFMDGLPKFVPDGTVYTGQRASAASSLAARKGINPGRFGVDENSVRFHEAIESYASTNKVSYSEAMTVVAKQHPELTVPGGMAASQA